MKSYYDFISDISANDLYEGLLGFGLFAEKLPPAFTAEAFLTYCKANPGFKKEKTEFITYNSMRNINIPRTMGIPNPMQYERLCQTLRDNWPKIQQHFQSNTCGQDYKISRIHIRKIHDKKTQKLKPQLFEMNYDNWKTDGTPENDLLMQGMTAAKYVIHADISTFFPGIYTHSLPWAFVGKGIAKADRKTTKWYNKIDSACQNIKNGETHGLLIGPHTSNLLSEIILTVIDKKLYDSGFRFVRHIDDYDCYVENYEKAQLFLNALEHELRQFDLPLNYKKTRIEELPISSTKHWKHRLNSVQMVSQKGYTTYSEINRFIDVAIQLAEEEKDSAVLKYAIKVLAGNEKVSENGKASAKKRLMHLAILYPYLLPLMEQYVFTPFEVAKEEIKAFSETLYIDSFRINNYEGVMYALYFGIRYGFEIRGLNCGEMIRTGDCLCLLFAWLYFKNKGGTELIALEQEAKTLSVAAMDRYWLFCYEALHVTDLPVGDWQTLKKAGISFLRELQLDNDEIAQDTDVE